MLSKAYVSAGRAWVKNLTKATLEKTRSVGIAVSKLPWAQNVAATSGRWKSQIFNPVSKVKPAVPKNIRGQQQARSLAGKIMAPIRHPATSITLGAVSMMGIGIMRGMNNTAMDISYDRYLRDTRFSRNVMNNTRVGRSHGMSGMLNNGSTTGLSLAMSSNRHGRGF